MDFEIIHSFHVDVEYLARSFVDNHLEQMLEDEQGITYSEIEAIDFEKLVRAVANEMLKMTREEEER